MSEERAIIAQSTERSLPVTSDDVEALKRQRELLKEFVASQLVEGIDNDYAVIPGTKKKSLLKPGAEKMARLFQLGIRIESAGKEIDRKGNFAMFTYRAEVYPLRNTDVIVAECEASCNSQEKKYKERTVWESLPNQANKVQRKEETPVCDILNTLMKMAQKRAFVGAVILAVGASDFFTQDIEDADDAKTLGMGKKEPTAPVQANIPTATAAASQHQAQPSSGSIDSCEVCGSALKLTKNRDAYNCPNWKDKSKGDHSYIKI